MRNQVLVILIFLGLPIFGFAQQEQSKAKDPNVSSSYVVNREKSTAKVQINNSKAYLVGVKERRQVEDIQVGVSQVRTEGRPIAIDPDGREMLNREEEKSPEN